MIDYIKATKHLQDKDTPFFGHCTLEARYSSGWEKYSLQGCEKLNVWHNPSYSMLRIDGSVMYYWQGHNFTYDKGGFVSAIKHIGTILHVDLWEAIINIFEYGTILEVQSKPKDYIQHHLASEELTMNEKPKDKGCFRWYEDSVTKLKMYDASRNIQYKQGLRRKEIIEESGWNPEGDYLKWEAHYLKPEILNHGRGILLADLVDPNWECVFKEDLYVQYKRLIPMKSILIPTDKKDYSGVDIFALRLVEKEINQGKTIDDVRKDLYAMINSNELLAKTDKDSRKRYVKTILGKIKEEPESKWDLSAQLEQALMVE